jgi:hypothetical protein
MMPLMALLGFVWAGDEISSDDLYICIVLCNECLLFLAFAALASLRICLCIDSKVKRMNYGIRCNHLNGIQYIREALWP